MGFSEHIQYRVDRGKYNRIDYEEFEKYFLDIEKLKKQYKKKIKILSGLEAAYVPAAMQDLLDLRDYCYFILLGQHQGGLNDRKYGLKCDNDDIKYYEDEVIRGIETGVYNIIAHPDYFMYARSTWDDACERCAYRICESSRKHNIPLELNIKGSYSFVVDNNGKQCIKYPYRKFWEIAEEVGNNVLYGWDAHSPEELFRTTEMIETIIGGLNLNIIEEINDYL